MHISPLKIIGIGFAVWIFIVLVYLAVATRFFTDGAPSNFPYFTLLAESLLHRRYDLIHPPANPFDLVVFNGAVYLPWGPLPALLVLPFVWLFGIGISDKVYSAVFGSFNVMLVYGALVVTNTLLKKRVSLSVIILLTLFFAFGTVHFSMSVIGRVWFTSQIVSLTVFLTSLLFLIVFLRFPKTHWFIISCGFLVLSLFGRLWYIALIPLYGSIFIAYRPSRRDFLVVSISILCMIGIFARMYGLYNLRRFGTVLETGYTYQQEAQQFLDLRHQFGRFNSIYVPKNIWYSFFNPIALTTRFPFIKPDPMGNGLFIISPLFMLLGLVGRIWTTERKLVLLCLGAVVLYGLQPMLFFGTGFFQFGHRYLLEIMPFLLIVLLPIVPLVSKKIVVPLWILSIVICSLGAWWLTVS